MSTNIAVAEQCAKMLDLHPQYYPAGAQERCLAPSLTNSTFCWEHQPQPDGKPQTSGWTAEQIEHARFGGVLIGTNDRVLGTVANGKFTPTLDPAEIAMVRAEDSGSREGRR